MQIIRINKLLTLPLVGLVAGILVQRSLGCSFYWTLFLGIPAIIIGYHYRTWLLSSIFFIVGLSVLPLQYNHIQYLRLRYTGVPCSLQGTVTDVQYAPGNLFEGIIHLNLSRIQHNNQSQAEKTNFSIMVYNKEHFDLEVGDEVYFEQITLTKPTDYSLAHNTSYADFLVKEHIVAAVFLQKEQLFYVLHRTSWSWHKWVWKQKNRVLSAIKQRVSPLAYAYFALIFLGYKQIAENHDLRKVFNLWGLAHFLARAGLHIMLFIWLWQMFLNAVPLPLACKRALLFIVCLMYAIFSWASIPFFRAYVMFVLTRTAQFLDQQTDFLHLLTATCMIVLLLNPMQLFFLDFQLTFALTFVLGWFAYITGRIYKQAH